MLDQTAEPTLKDLEPIPKPFYEEECTGQIHKGLKYRGRFLPTDA